MKKSVLISVAVFLSATTFGQSNQPGTIQIGLGWGVTVGGATITTKTSGGEITGDGVGAKINYGLRAQFGLTESISAGVYVRPEAAVYATSFTDETGYAYTSTDIDYTGMGFGIEGKYYIVNKDKFNLSPNLGIGYNTGSGTPDLSGAEETDLSGIGWSIGIGGNWYFAAETFGISFDLGYEGINLSGTQAATVNNGNVETDWDVSNGGVTFGFGLTVKFGGN